MFRSKSNYYSSRVYILFNFFSDLLYTCHHWNEEELEKKEIGYPLKSMCEAHNGFIYTGGNEALAPGCSCGCCKPGEKLC